MTGIDIDAITAIDVHTHAEVSARGQGSLSDELQQASSKYFKIDGAHRKPSLSEIAAYYRERKMACVVFTVDAEAATGVPGVPNEEIAEAAAENSDVIIPFASIDPAKGKAGVREVRRLVRDFGMRGFSSTPVCRRSTPTTASPTRCTRRSRRRARSPSSTPGRPASAREHPVVAASG